MTDYTSFPFHVSVGCSHFRVYHGLLWAFTFVNHSQIIGTGFQQYTQIVKQRRPLTLSREYKFRVFLSKTSTYLNPLFLSKPCK